MHSFEDTIEFAKKYHSLGDYVIEQLHDLLDRGATAECNADAVRLIAERLAGHKEITDACNDWLATHVAMGAERR